MAGTPGTQMSAFGSAAAAPVACPCDPTRPYAACCGPLHVGERLASTAEELMRSRYSAFAVGDLDHLVRTWHPRTRPATLERDPDPDERTEWVGLDVVSTDAGEVTAETGLVEFIAHWRRAGARGRQHEVSTFVRRAGRWVYVDGQCP